MNTPTQQTEIEVAMTSECWSSFMRPLSSDVTLTAFGKLRSGEKAFGQTLIVDEVQINREMPVGDDFAPLTSWIVIGMPGSDAPDSPAEWIDRLNPGFAQQCVVLLIGFGSDRSEWRGWAIERGEVQPLAGFRVVGAPTINVQRKVVPPTHKVTVTERWTRLVDAVGQRAFARLQEASVVLIGCSRSGTLVASMLTALGIRRLGLIDGDKIESHNLDGMILATEQDLGMNKAIALGRRLELFRGDIALAASSQSFGTRYEEPVIGTPDLIVTCVDQNGARLRAARLARQRLIPHLDIGTGVTTGVDGSRELAADVRFMLPGAGCVRCVGGFSDPEAADFSSQLSPGYLPKRREEAWNARGRLGSLITVNSMAVSTGIQTWLDFLAGDLEGSVWHRIRWETGGSWQIDDVLVSAEGGCPVCKMDR